MRFGPRRPQLVAQHPFDLWQCEERGRTCWYEQGSGDFCTAPGRGRVREEVQHPPPWRDGAGTAMPTPPPANAGQATGRRGELPGRVERCDASRTESLHGENAGRAEERTRTEKPRAGDECQRARLKVGALASPPVRLGRCRAHTAANQTFPRKARIMYCVTMDVHLGCLPMATLIVSALTLIAVVWYAWIAKGQLEQMRLATKAATIQAKASTDSLEFANRAWVAAFAFTAKSDPAGKIVGVDVSYRNTGKTPALRLKVSSAWVPQDDSIPSQDAPMADVPTMLLAPEAIGRVTVDMPPEAVTSVLQGGPGGFIFGTIWYDDIFGRSHWIQFSTAIGARFETFIACTGHDKSSDG